MLNSPFMVGLGSYVANAVGRATISCFASLRDDDIGDLLFHLTLLPRGSLWTPCKGKSKRMGTISSSETCLDYHGISFTDPLLLFMAVSRRSSRGFTGWESHSPCLLPTSLHQSSIYFSNAYAWWCTDACQCYVDGLHVHLLQRLPSGSFYQSFSSVWGGLELLSSVCSWSCFVSARLVRE